MMCIRGHLKILSKLVTLFLDIVSLCFENLKHSSIKMLARIGLSSCEDKDQYVKEEGQQHKATIIR